MHSNTFPSQSKTQFHQISITNQSLSLKPIQFPTLSCQFSETTTPTFAAPPSSDSEEHDEDEEERESDQHPSTNSYSNGGMAPPVLKKRKRYRKEYPGERKGITEEMRFVAMKLRNDQGSRFSGYSASSDDDKSDDGDDTGATGKCDGTWEPTIEGFVKYLVDSKLVFEALERVVEDSNDVSYAYFRKTGLERSESLARDLEWFSQQDIVIPEPSNPGISYATYLKELGEKSPLLFLSHFYNVYFSHIAGGQVIAKQVAEKLLEGRELEFYKWEGEAEELLKEVRQKLNRLSEYWSRDDKNKCLREATKAFRYLGQIVRLIVL